MPKSIARRRELAVAKAAHVAQLDGRSEGCALRRRCRKKELSGGDCGASLK